MTTRSGPIHEVTFFVDADVVDDFDQWLEEHARNSLQIASVSDCRCFPIADDQYGRAGRICQYLLEDEQALDEYLENRFVSIDGDVTGSFGEKVEMSDRVLREDQSQDSQSDESLDCRNCGEVARSTSCRRPITRPTVRRSGASCRWRASEASR